MHHEQILTLLTEFKSGGLSAEEVARSISSDVADTGDTKLDLDRQRRCGFPEVVYAESKTVESLRQICATHRKMKLDMFATRLSQEKADEILPEFPEAVYNPIARTLKMFATNDTKTSKSTKKKIIHGKIVIITAGTSDLPVAEEASETALWTGAEVELIQDVGVAGPHRLRAVLPQLEGAAAIIVVAGMEGALPSVVGGYVSCPIIAVPTSVG
ncbi:MAG: nickel pincer cofactor biosynthesis protein LarB, partial [Thermoguttaceae bacterium]